MRIAVLGSCISLLSATAGQAELIPVSNPPEVKIEMLLGDLKSSGLYVVRARLPADGLVRPHYHDVDRWVSVSAGTLYSCNSEQVTASKVAAYKAGEFFKIPAKQTHCSWAKDGAVEYLEIGIGPVGTTRLSK